MFDFSHFLTDTYSVALAALLLAALVYLCLYYGLYHFRVGRHGRKRQTEAAEGDLPPVSVVLTAHNEDAWLRENLVYLLEQDYPDFEVVVVDYLSTDNTNFTLKLLRDYYPHLKVVPFKEDVNLFQGKKYPLSIGIKSAKNDVLMLADPDCTPKNLLWLRGMVRGYRSPEGGARSSEGGARSSELRVRSSELGAQSSKSAGKKGASPKARPQTQIVLGYCGVKRTRTLLGWLQQYDALAYGSQYLGSALMGHPYTGSGRNLSYRRSFFFSQGAFIRHYDVADGSDDLFVYQNATRRNTAICIDSDACLVAEPRPTFRQWRDDRRHRVATRNRHKLIHRLRESMPAWANLVFYAAAVLLVVAGNLPWPVVAAAVALKWAWQIVCFAQLTRRFDGGHVHWAAPLMELWFIVSNTALILLPLPNNRKF